MRIVGPDDGPPAPLWKRLAWFFGIAAAAGFGTVLVAYALRAALLA